MRAEKEFPGNPRYLEGSNAKSERHPDRGWEDAKGPQSDRAVEEFELSQCTSCRIWGIPV